MTCRGPTQDLLMRLAPATSHFPGSHARRAQPRYDPRNRSAAPAVPFFNDLLDPPRLALDKHAFEVWRHFHDDVERELPAKGEYGEHRDFAAKIAEQAARVAWVFHVIEHGPHGTVNGISMEAGAAIAIWHLHEARRVLGLVGVSGELTDAQAVLEWLQDHPEASTPRDLLRLGPYRTRSRKRRDKALEILAEHHLVREQRDGKTMRLILNPEMVA